jgi:hypothetical protein
LILLATNKRDITTDFVLLELKRRRIPYARLNTEDIAQWTVRLPDGDPAAFEASGRTNFRVDEVKAAYYRRPEAPSPSPGDTSASGYAVAEWSSLLRTLWNSLEGKWLNSPYAILRAEDKPRQLATARRFGLRTPRTLVTNDPVAAHEFSRHVAAVAKPLRRALLEDAVGPGRVIFTTRIGVLDPGDESIRLAPIILQEEIPKRADIRVTVIDDSTYAVAIESQHWEETSVDWRRGSNPNVPHRPITLDNETSKRCIAVTRDLGLRFAAIDLVQDINGDFWFLEANPNGQWAWIEQRTGLPITANIVDALMRDTNAARHR